MNRYLECGKIVSTHGIKGELKVQPWCDSPEYLCSFKSLYLEQGRTLLKIIASRPHKGMALLTVEGVTTADDAAEYRGRVLYLDREDDPDAIPGSFIQDLIGLEVIDADTGILYGRLSDVLETGANNVYSVKAEAGRELLVPAIPDVIISVDVMAGRMLIRPLEGLFDDAD